MIRIAIHSVPRSGSSWLGCIFDSNPQVQYRYQPLFSYAFKGMLSEQSTLSDIRSYYSQILSSKDQFINQVHAKERGIVPAFKKDKTSAIAYKEVRYHYILPNLLTSDNTLKAILLIRDPVDVLNSWLNAPREFRFDLGWTFQKEWLNASKKNLGRREEYFGFAKWKEVAKMFLSLESDFKDRVYVIRYEDLLDNTIENVERLFEFCQLPFTEQTAGFIDASKNKNVNDPYSVYKSFGIKGVQPPQIPETVLYAIRKDLLGTELGQFMKT